MNYDQQDVWMMQFATFFVTRYSYRMLSVQDAKDEIWLANPRHSSYLTIRITKQDIDDNYFDHQRVKQIHSVATKAFKTKGKCLELYMNEKDEIESDDESIQFTVHPNWQGNEQLQAIYPGIDKVCHVVEDPDEECKVLSEALINFQKQEKIRQGKLRAAGRKFLPYVSTSIGAICVIIFVLSVMLINGDQDINPVSILLGSYYKAFIIGMNEWFRLLTAGFVHVDLYHIFLNMLALFNIGNYAEAVYGHLKYTAIMLFSIIMGNCFVFIGAGNIVSLGLSGGLYGLMAALLVYFVSSGIWKDKSVRNQFTYMLAINVLISFMPGTSLMGHLGGFVGGLILSFILVDNENWKSLQRNTIVAAIIFCIGVVSVIATNRKIDKVYFGTDLAVIELTKKLNLDFYGDHILEEMTRYYTEGE